MHQLRRPSGNVDQRRLRKKSVAHLSAKLHAFLVCVVSHSIVERGVDSVVGVLCQRFHKENLEALTNLQPHFLKSR